MLLRDCGTKVRNENGKLTHRVSNGEDVDGNDHYPSTNTVVGMYTVRGVEQPHEKHTGEDKNTAVESGGTTAPFVDEHESDDRGDADEDGGNTRGKKCGFGRGDTGLLE